MKKNIILLIYLISSIFTYSQSLDLFVIAGQSNAQGLKAYVSDYPTLNQSLDADIKLFWRNWSITPNSSNSWITMQGQPSVSGGNINIWT